MEAKKVSFPNESSEYRAARQALLETEAEVRIALERVAAQRRELPLGGRVREDYGFERLGKNGKPETVKISELFAPGKDSLFIYSFMYGPKAERPCPLCTSMLDSLDGSAPHIGQRVNLAVVARSPIQRIAEFARERGWSRLSLLSSSQNSYNADYLAEDADGNQLPMANVFVKRDGAVHHFWASELLYRPAEAEGIDRRHVDLMWPLWNVFDMTPDGRGGDWYPALSYD